MNFFCKQCTPVGNDSTLPPLLEAPKIDIGKIIKALNLRKAHGHDDIYISMLKLCEFAFT